MKWSTVRPAVNALSSTLLESWEEKDSILAMSDRWSPAQKPQNYPSDEQVKKMLPKMYPSLSLGGSWITISISFYPFNSF